MRPFKTTDAHMQWAVQIINSLFQRSERLLSSKYSRAGNPDLSRVRWVLGHRQRHALDYCRHALMESGATDNETTEVFGFKVVWVHDDDFAELMEGVG